MAERRHADIAAPSARRLFHELITSSQIGGNMCLMLSRIQTRMVHVALELRSTTAHTLRSAQRRGRVDAGNARSGGPPHLCGTSRAARTEARAASSTHSSGMVSAARIDEVLKLDLCCERCIQRRSCSCTCCSVRRSLHIATHRVQQWCRRALLRLLTGIAPHVAGSESSCCELPITDIVQSRMQVIDERLRFTSSMLLLDVLLHTLLSLCDAPR